MAMDAYRRGDDVFIHFDLPGVDSASIELTAEQNTLTVRADRHWDPRATIGSSHGSDRPAPSRDS